MTYFSLTNFSWWLLDQILITIKKNHYCIIFHMRIFATLCITLLKATLCIVLKFQRRISWKLCVRRECGKQYSLRNLDTSRKLGQKQFLLSEFKIVHSARAKKNYSSGGGNLKRSRFSDFGALILSNVKLSQKPPYRTKLITVIESKRLLK